MRRQPDLSHFREPETVGDRIVNWLAHHPRWTCFAICLLCMSAGWLDRVLP
jgi:hypothetical protein